MDTKLKKSKIKKNVCIASSLVFVISAVTLFITSMVLIVGYQYAYSYTIVKSIQSDISKVWMLEIPMILLTCVSLVVSLVTCGEEDEEGKIKLNWFDRIFNGFQIIAAILAGCAYVGSGYIFADYLVKSTMVQEWVRTAFDLIPEDVRKSNGLASMEDLFNWSITPTDFEPRWVELAVGIILTAAVTAFILLVVLSIVKKIKAGSFWSHTIVGKLIIYLKNSAGKSNNVFWKVMLLLILGCLVSATWIGTIVVLLLIIFIVPKMLNKFEKIKEGVEEVKNGNLDYKIPVEDYENGELDKLAKSINEISQATSIAAQNEIVNQRMKTDLISNVSHDLKTPLTSMVTYVDLLKREGLDSEHALEYLDIVEEKTKRLKKLTEDLFEAAKASSGAIPVNIERIEMTSIVNQALAELNEKLEQNNLQVYFNPKADVNFVMADGQLLWRVIENLLVNTSKYALPGSRVYMDITEKGEDQILLEVKNVSAESLNISADELMERFKRGDDSRNTEGSGLGLAIAKDLVKLMDGWFEINIDGDLFKASVALKKAE